MAAQGARLGFCDACHSEVPATKNPHRVRNTTAANFAAANLGLCAEGFGVFAFGPTGPYVCPYCGGEVRPRPASERRST
jgi:hypothetical protein